MKILLLGEYSNVHATLADGLRALGHDVTVVSNGDFWKNYPRDIDVSRRSGKLGGIMLVAKILTLLPKLRGFDIVQFINPMFFELKAERLQTIYRYLRCHNKKLVLGAFGMDYYWVHENITRLPLRYSDFNIGSDLRTDKPALREIHDWLGTPRSNNGHKRWTGTPKGLLCQTIANDCDAIVCGLYEYWACYHPLFPTKTTFIPFPIKVIQNSKFLSPAKADRDLRFKIQNELLNDDNRELITDNRKLITDNRKLKTENLKLFIGISRGRSAYKGTDIMLRAAQAIKNRYPNRVELRVANGVPFDEYQKLMQGSDAILDQLYSYTPSMNPLEAMSHGIICIGGGEPENYDILGCTDLRPIINVLPTYDSVYHELEQIVLHPERIPVLKSQSIEYIRRYHDHLKVAHSYADLYTNLLNQ